MSTVCSIDTYCKIRGISSQLVLMSDSQDIDSLAGYVDRQLLDQYGSFMAIARDGDIELIWGVSSYVPWDTSYCELIWSSKAFYRSIVRQTKRNARIARSRKNAS